MIQEREEAYTKTLYVACGRGTETYESGLASSTP